MSRWSLHCRQWSCHSLQPRQSCRWHSCVGEVYHKSSISVLYLHSDMHPSRLWSMDLHLRQNQAMVLTSLLVLVLVFFFCSVLFSMCKEGFLKKDFLGYHWCSNLQHLIFRNSPIFGQHSTMPLGMLSIVGISLNCKRH